MIMDKVNAASMVLFASTKWRRPSPLPRIDPDSRGSRTPLRTHLKAQHDQRARNNGDLSLFVIPTFMQQLHGVNAISSMFL